MAWPAALALMLGLVCLAMLLACRSPSPSFLTNIIGRRGLLGGENGIMSFLLRLDGVDRQLNLGPVPLFLVMGDILLKSGMAFRAIDAIDRLILAVPGRLSVVAVSGGTIIFGAVGIDHRHTPPCWASRCCPKMLRRGYHPSMAMDRSWRSAASTLLIPPSALTVLLATLASSVSRDKVSVSDLLIAGIIPA